MEDDYNMNIGDMFCNSVVQQNRELVRNSIHCNAELDLKGLVGYCYNDDGTYDTPVYLEDGAEALAEFITSNNRDKLVYDMLDMAVCNTQGMYLDLQHFASVENFEAVRQLLIPDEE